MTLHSDAIWLPGTGMLSLTERHAAEAVEEYDPELMLGQRKDTGEWCAFLPGNRASDGEPFPVFSFGRELPAPEKIKQMLYTHDIKRNGRELLDQLDRIFETEQKQIADRTSESAEAVAEAIASKMNADGVHPFPTIHLAGKYKKGHVRSSG